MQFSGKLANRLSVFFVLHASIDGENDVATFTHNWRHGVMGFRGIGFAGCGIRSYLGCGHCSFSEGCEVGAPGSAVTGRVTTW